MKDITLNKDLTLIVFLLLIGSGYFMRLQFPYLNSSSENNLKMFSSSLDLSAFYKNSLNYKQNIVCNQCVPIESGQVKIKLLNYYKADFLFLACYSFLFWVIAWYLKRKSEGIYAQFAVLFKVLILMVFISDAMENIFMLNYIESDFSKYSIAIKIFNIIKTIGFIILSFLLLVRRPQFLLEGFNKCIR